MPYAFVCHASALEALRMLDTLEGIPTWPSTERLLPIHGECVRNQRMFRELDRAIGFSAHGMLERPVDLLVPHENMRSRGKSARFHVWKQCVPLHEMLRLQECLFVSKPAFVLVQMAGHHPKLDPILDDFTQHFKAEQSVMAELGIEGEPLYDPDPVGWELAVRLVELTKVACELLGTYRCGHGSLSTQYHRKPLMKREDVEGLLARLPGLYGAARVRRCLELAFDGSASPRETTLALMLTLPPEMGGFGLPRPELNVDFDANGMTVSGAQENVYPDLYWEDADLVLEYDSDEFHGKAGPKKWAEDAARANALTAAGYRVMRATGETVTSLVQLGLLARQLSVALGVELPEVDAVGQLRRSRLHAVLIR